MTRVMEMAVAEQRSAVLKLMKEVDVTIFNGGSIQKEDENVDSPRVLAWGLYLTMTMLQTKEQVVLDIWW